MTSCSVVIRAYNEAMHIGRLLEGLARQTVRTPEVILVDSGSTDSTVDLATAAGAKVIHILPEEFTFGRSLNCGLAAATGTWLSSQVRMCTRFIRIGWNACWNHSATRTLR